ncbi:tetratricopeptide repeat protein [Rhodovulum sp. YNF3179]|uniref:tetratricopeptide repeat protein n=1 Tax=Rhodovulum sp. YNF3179 TaxID=3425127 RepID=UPI003D33CD5B
MRWLVLTLAFAAPAPALADCPPLPDRAEERARLMEDLRNAPDPLAGQRASDAMWAFWATAPDARAQEMLDRGMARRAAYDFDGARAAFEDLIAYCPEYYEGYNQRAFVRFLTGDYGGALEDLNRTLARRPDHVGALSGKALTLMQLGRIKASQGVLREAVKLNPWLPERGLLIEEPGTEL